MNRLLAATLFTAALLTAQSRNPVQWTVETQGATDDDPGRHGAGLAHLRADHSCRRTHPDDHKVE